MHEATVAEDWYGAETSTFGDRMAGARERTGMSRQQLARRMGVKTTTIESWEEDLSEPRANKLQMLAGILNVSMPWLLTAEGEGLPAPEEETMTPAEIEPMLAELRQVRAEMLRFANKVSVLEKRLRHAAHAAGHLGEKR